MKPITKTIYQSDGMMSDTPAAIDRETGTLFINRRLYEKLTKFQRKFVILHERGHYELNTDIEEEADAFAFDHLVGTEYRSMKQMIETLETILDPNRIGHQARIEALYRRALAWDKAHPIKVSKASGGGSSDSAADTLAAAAELINSANQGTTDAIKIVETKETNSDNNRTMVYMMLAIAALFLLKD